jgi:hypothetical protein
MPSSIDPQPTSMTPSAASPPPSSPCDPMTPDQSTPPTSKKRSPATSPPSSPADPAIRWEDRIFLCGTTSSGKSTFARQLYLGAAGPRLVVDPVGSDLTVLPGSVTFSDPIRPTNRAGERWADAAHARFVPNDPDDLDAYQALYQRVFEDGRTRRRHWWVWCDEAEFVLPSTGKNRAGRKLLIQGRKLPTGHLACNPRPVNVDRNLIAQAAHVFVFSTPDRDDRAILAKNMGVPLEVFEDAHAQLVEYGFLWWQQRARKLIISKPVRL